MPAEFVKMELSTELERIRDLFMHSKKIQKGEDKRYIDERTAATFKSRKN